MGILDPEEKGVEWTAKLPALLAAIALVLGALLAHAKGFRLVAAVLAALALAFLGYSLTIKEWCSTRGQIAASGFSSAFAPTFAQCAKQKGWMSF